MRSALELWGGIECTVNRVGDDYVDQLELSGHARRDSDLELLAGLGIRTWRYPVLWERTAPDGVPDWSWPDRRLGELRRLGLDPIVGLVHHGSGPRHTGLTDPRFPELLADYARQVAERYPWVRRWTPVNEPLSTARFSGLDGHWHPHGLDNVTFARVLVHECLGIQRAMAEIRRVVPEAELVLTEDVCRHTSTPRLAPEREFRNTRRFLGIDLVCGAVTPAHPLYRWLLHHQVEQHALEALEAGACRPAILGANYYVTSDRFLDEHPERQPPWRQFHGPLGPYGETESVRCLSAGTSGHRALLGELWSRYRVPLAVTEVHLGCTREEQVRWLLEAWDAALAARADGVDVRAITAWGAFGLVGWDRLVTRPHGARELGMFDVRSDPPRPTAVAKVARALATGAPVDAPYGGLGWWRRPARLLGRPAIDAPDPGCAPHLPQPPARASRPLLVTGGGAVARAIVAAAHRRNLDAHLVPCDLERLDAELAWIRPWAVVHAAGAGGRADRVEQLHAVAPGWIAASCERRDLRFAHLSSALVLSGPGPHSESAPLAPRGELGRAQALGEARSRAAHPGTLVIRCGEIVGADRDDDRLSRMLQTLSRRGVVSVPDPASAVVAGALVEALLDLLIDGESGVWHLAHRRPLVEVVAEAARIAGFDPRDVRADPSEGARLTSERGHVLPPLEDALHTHWDPRRSRILEEVIG